MHETLIFEGLESNAFLNRDITSLGHVLIKIQIHQLCLIFNRNPKYFFLCLVKRHFTSCNVTI